MKKINCVPAETRAHCFSSHGQGKWEIEQIRKLLTTLLFWAWGHRTEKEGMACPYQLLPLGGGEIGVMFSLGKPGSHQANKICDSFSYVNSQPLHKRWKQLSTPAGWHRPSDLTQDLCQGSRDPFPPASFPERAMWCHGIVPAPLLFYQDFWAVNHVRQHLWQCRSRFPC